MDMEKKELYEKIWLILDEHEGDTDAQARAVLELMTDEGFLSADDEECPTCGGWFGPHEYANHVMVCSGGDDDDEDSYE